MAQFQTLQIPLVKGLDTKRHPHLLDPPGLTRAQNVQFDTGGLSLRYPFAALGSNIYPSGTLSNVRKLHAYGDELLAFTDTALYSWSSKLTAWVSRGDHLAVKVEETTAFNNTTDQVFADRAQLSGVVVMAWTEVLGATSLSYVAAYDATTKVTLIAPTSLGAGAIRPRVVALTTKILVAWNDSVIGPVCKAITPGTPSFTPAGPTSLTVGNGDIFDIVKDPDADQALYVATVVGGASYEVGKVTAALAVTAVSKARTADGCIAIAPGPAGTGYLTVVRETFAAGLIRADMITTLTLADLTVNTSLGAPAGATVLPLSQLTAATRSATTGGFYQCHAFWTVRTSSDEETTETNWIDTTAAIGVLNSNFSRTGLASRAFDHGGQVYVWTVFAEVSGVAGAGTGTVSLGFRGQLQNSYFLLRDDESLHAKAAWQVAGGDGHYTGHLAGVALISGTTAYAWAGTERQLITLGGEDQRGYGARAPRDIPFTFDSDEARRVIQVGRTLYVSGGLVLQYDSEALTELGFCQFPWVIQASAGAGGAADAGAYTYIATLRSDNARGEVDRSTTAVAVQINITALQQVDVVVQANRVTRRLTMKPPAVEIWRTKVNPSLGAPFYLVTSRDPSATGDNGYLSLDDSPSVTLAGDVFTDAILGGKEQHPENGAVLPRIAPPPATIMAATDARLFLAGIPGQPSRIWYSLQRNDGEVPGFNSDLSITLPSSTGAITALAIMDGTLFAATATACYAIPGDGFDNTGGGSNYGPARLLSSDIGCVSADTVTVSPIGLLFYSRKGWYRINQGWGLEYIGARVEDFNADTWVAAQVVESQHQVRMLSSSRMLVYDYLVDEWAEWTETGGRGLAMWRGTAMMLDAAVKRQATSFESDVATYTMDIETGWIRPLGLMGRCRVRFVQVLGETVHEHSMRVRIGVNEVTSSYADDRTITQTNPTGDPARGRIGLRIQRLESLRVRVTLALSDDAGDNAILTGLALDVAPEGAGTRRINPTFNK